MDQTKLYVGLDVHARTINVSVLHGEKKPEEWQLANEPKSVAALARRLRREAGDSVVCCYEAGPTGFGLKRTLDAKGIDCRVIAPALIPTKPGDRVKTDRRDARNLAHLLRAGLLTEVHQPTERQESVRNLTRGREDAVAARKTAQVQLSGFLLRAGHHYGKSTWTREHRCWLRSLSFEELGDQAAFDGYLQRVEMADEHIRLMEQRLSDIVASEEYAPEAGLLRCFRGIDTVTAMTILGELGDITRFGSPDQLAAYVGLVASEHSSGPRTRRGGITKTGNEHVRRVLVEAGWHSIRPYRVGAPLRRRRQGQPGWAVAMADKTGSRMSRRYRHLKERGKPSQVAVVAVARELLAAIWAVLRTHAEERQQAA